MQHALRKTYDCGMTVSYDEVPSDHILRKKEYTLPLRISM